MREFVPEVQDGLRKALPKMVERIVPSVVFEAGMSMPRVEQVALFEFQDVAQTTGVVLADSFLSFHTTVYRTYEEFEDQFSSIVSQIHSIVDLGLLERCGLRYVDAITLREGELLNQYVRAGMLGLDPVGIGNITAPVSESVFRATTEIGTLVVRFAQLPEIVTGASFFPADLQPMSLKFSHREDEKLVGALDFDHFSVTSSAFEPNDAMQMLGSLHDAIDRAFRASVSPAAFKL